MLHILPEGDFLSKTEEDSGRLFSVPTFLIGLVFFGLVAYATVNTSVGESEKEVAKLLGPLMAIITSAFAVFVKRLNLVVSKRNLVSVLAALVLVNVAVLCFGWL
ncbi:hypothetical protein HY311_00205 [Candidatus Nomurabacteria bacterium]|nr:hypothetical protein [Candidatus Nomurabacteria bacterium]